MTDFYRLIDKLSKLSDINISNPADKNLLQYDSATAKWLNKSLAEAGISATGHTHNYVPFDENGNITLSSTKNLVFENQIALNLVSGKIGFYGSGSWRNIYRSGNNIVINSPLTINGVFTGATTISGTTISGTSLIISSGDIFGANTTALNIGGDSAGRLILAAATGIYSNIQLKSGNTSAALVRFKDTPSNIGFHVGGVYPITFYEDSTEGKNQPFSIYGYPTSAGSLLKGSFQVIRDSGANYFRLSTDAAGGFDFDSKPVKGISTLSVQTSININSVNVLPAIDEDNMASDLDTKVPTQQSVKAYVDAKKDYALWVGINGGLTVAANTTYYIPMVGYGTTTEARGKIYIPRGGTIKAAILWSITSGAAGDAGDWSLYVRYGGQDTLIETETGSATEHVWANFALSIAVNAGDYFSIKMTTPNPWNNVSGAIYIGGYVFIEP